MAEMLKVLLVVAVLLGAAWSYGPTRQEMANGLLPVAERLGPVGDVIAKPVRTWATRSEVRFIVDQIRMRQTEGREVPTERTFNTWLRTWVKTKRNGLDAWGAPYYLVSKRKKQATVGSVGPDGERGTADDITETIEL